jgi:hypothetical protein
MYQHFKSRVSCTCIINMELMATKYKVSLTICYCSSRKHSLSTIKEQLITNCYLCSSACGIIRSKYLQLSKKLCWESGEDILNPPNQAIVTVSVYSL